MIAYASYLPKKVNLVQDALIISFGNGVFSFVAGFAVFGTLGYMAHVTGQPVSEVVKESVGLAFVAYPQAISLMPGLAKIFGVVFFTSLVIAGLSSAISILEAFTAALIDKFGFKREIVISHLCMLGFILSLVFTSHGGLFWLDIADRFITHYGLVVVGILECFLVGWVWQASKLRKHINQCAPKSLSVIWDYCVKFMTPMVLMILMVNDLRIEISAPYGGYDWRAILLIGPLWLVLSLIASLFISQYPWQKEVENHIGH